MALKTAKYGGGQEFCQEMEVGLLREAEIMAKVGLGTVTNRVVIQ